VADLFTAADDGRLAEPGRPAAADAVGRLDAFGEPGEDGALSFEGRVGSGCPGRVVPRKAPFGEGEVNPADSGELADGVDAGSAGLLTAIHPHEPRVGEFAAEGQRELQAWGEGMADAHRVDGNRFLGSGDGRPVAVEPRG